MMDVECKEYRQLVLESSNLLMEWDGLWLLGCYEEAAFAVRQAGAIRFRMGQFGSAEGRFGRAAEDWLSSAACFAQASAEGEATRALEQVRKLTSEGRFPGEQSDLLAVLREREESVGRLGTKIKDFYGAWGASGFKARGTSEDALAFLLGWVRELPGFAPLHFLISRQADRLGRPDLAVTHLLWAARFDPPNETYAALYGRKLIEAERFEEAQRLGRNFLAARPESALVRLMLACALIAGRETRSSGLEQAVEVLRPVTGHPGANLKHGVIALALSLVLHHLLGQEGEEARLRRELETMEDRVGDPTLKSSIDDLREALAASLNGNARPADGAPPALSESHRRLFLEIADTVVVPAG
jgi:tetratricopeptide (TPR) repeat protein